MPDTQLPAFDSATLPFPATTTAPVERWNQAYELLIGAERSALLDMPARPLFSDLNPGQDSQHLEDLPDAADMNSVRLPVIARQLHLLGYLEDSMDGRSARRVAKSDRFRSAVGQFQAEAGLTVDHWVGRQTWEALSTLISFETKTQVNRWRRLDESYYPAFRRAVQLRLYCYGLANKIPQQNFSAIPRANLDKAEAVLRLLNAFPIDQAPTKQQIYTLLLDPDQLLSLVADSPLTTQGTRHEQPLLRRFLVNVAKIELWLLGLPSKIDSRDDYPVEGFKRATARIRSGGRFGRTKVLRNAHLREALQEYWQRLQGYSRQDSSKRAQVLSGELFQSLRDPRVQPGVSGEPSTDDDYSAELIRTFESRGELARDVEESWRQGRSLGMRLWDGLKRLWRWVKRGIKTIIEIGKNLYRTFFRFALKAYKIARTAFSALGQSLEQYLAGRLNMPTGNTVVVGLSKDLDYLVVLPPDADSELLTAAANQVDRFSAAFYFASRLIGVFVDGLTKVVTGLAGWLRLLMSLVQSYRSLVPAYRELVAVL